MTGASEKTPQVAAAVTLRFDWIAEASSVEFCRTLVLHKLH